MRNIIKYLFVFGISMIICLTKAKAINICSNSEKAELNKTISNIRVNYEEMERQLDPSEYDITDSPVDTKKEPVMTDYLKVNLVNLSDKFYTIVTNDYNDETKTYTYNETEDGILSFNWENMSKVTTFTFNIYTSDKTNCAGELIYTTKIKLPRYNDYSKESICSGIPNFNLCQKYVTYDNIDYATFMKRTEKYIESLNKQNKNEDENLQPTTIWEKITEFISNNKYYFIGGGIVVLVGIGYLTFIIVKRRRSMNI